MIIMGVDLGHARTGLSLCDELEMLASPSAWLRSAARSCCSRRSRTPQKGTARS